jgi:hypothetical protein
LQILNHLNTTQDGRLTLIVSLNTTQSTDITGIKALNIKYKMYSIVNDGGRLANSYLPTAFMRDEGFRVNGGGFGRYTINKIRGGSVGDSI